MMIVVMVMFTVRLRSFSFVGESDQQVSSATLLSDERVHQEFDYVTVTLDERQLNLENI